ncbi:hypothetical protein KHA80_18315 [Anaerobacillus sp. HL2]|nr:hypothetical protein KHA80_18315 [Anaerobacillus sp. HL2]
MNLSKVFLKTKERDLSLFLTNVNVGSPVQSLLPPVNKALPASISQRAENFETILMKPPQNIM